MGSSKAEVVYHNDWATYEDSQELFIIELSDDRYFYIEIGYNPYESNWRNNGFISFAEAMEKIEEFEECIKNINFGDML